MKLFVDDIRNPPDQPKWWQFWKKRWIVVRNHDDAIRVLTEAKIEVLSLDHDLGEDSKTGYDIACWLEERAAWGMPVPKMIFVHSANPVGRKNIEMAITSIKRYADGR